MKLSSVLSVFLLPFMLIGVSHGELLLRNSSTVAGIYGIAGTTDGPTATATLAGPGAVAPAFFSSAASAATATTPLVIGDSELIRLEENNNVTTLFGQAGVVGLANGNKTTARVNGAVSMIYMPDDGYVYFVEPRNNVVRRLNRTNVDGFIGSSTGVGGFVDGTTSDARLLTPGCIAYAVDENTFYIADTANSALRRVTRAGVVTTSLTGLTSPFYATASGDGRVFLLNRPSSSTVGVVIFFINNQTSFQWIPTTIINYVAIGFDVLSSRLFAAAVNRVHELFLANGSFAVVAGVGTAYLDGPTPRFNYLNNMYVSSYRSIYLVAGPQAYVIRRLSFDPPAPIPVNVVFASPTIFPIDNTTALNVTLAFLTAIVNAQLGTNGTTLIGSVVFDSVLRQTNVTVLVPNETYTSTTAATLQPSTTNYSQVFASLSSYYALTDFSFLLDPLELPFLVETGANRNASAFAQLRALLEAEARSLLQYNYTFTALPVWVTNTTDGSNLSSWKLLLPASFANSTTIALLSTALHTAAYTFGASLYAPDVYVNIPTSLFPQLPLTNATAMQEIRLLLQQEVESMFAFSPSGIDPLTFNATTNTYMAKVFVPNSFSPSTNATTQALLGNATWSLLAQYLSTFYPVAHTVVFDETKVPSSDSTAVAAIVALLQTEVNSLLTGSSSSKAIGVGAQPVVNVSAHTTTFSVYVPLSYEIAANNGSAVTAENNTISAMLQADPYATVQNFLYQYYLQSSTMYHATFSALSLPLFNASLMESLRIAIGNDLAAALNFTDVGANSTVLPVFATTLSTGIVTPGGSSSSTNGSSSAGVLIGPSDTVYFPLLIPPWLVNTSLANTTFASLTADGFPTFQELLQANMLSGLNITVDSTLLPVNNATAMERLRQLLTVALRELANSTDSSLSVLPAVTVNGSAVSYQIVGPAGALANFDVAAFVQQFLNAATQSGNGTIASFLTSYYATSYSVSLPYDIVPWSNDTTMDAVKSDIVTDVTNALSSIAATSDVVHVQSVVVAKDPNRTVTFYLLVPPAYTNTAAKSALAVTALNQSTLPVTTSFLYQYFPKNITVSLDGNMLPWANASAMATVRAIVADYLATDVFIFANVGTNSSVYNTTDGRVYFKVIVPPSFDNASTWANVTFRLNLADIANLTSFLRGYYPANYAAVFPTGLLPTNNATAMEAIRKLLQLDVVDLLQYPSIGVENSSTVTDNTTGISTLQFPLLIPPSFDNATTAQLLINATYARVLAYLAVYYATPAPPTPVPAFQYTSSWPIDALPSGNATQMTALGEALFQDIVNSLKLSPEQVNVSSWQLSTDGTTAQWIVTLPTFANNATTGTILQDTANNYPIFQALLAEFTQGNLIGIGGASSTVDEGCSRGCVIGVAAVGAIIVTAGIIGIVVMTSKKRRTATVIAPKFSSVMEDDEPMPPAADESPQRSRKARNPLEMA